jgi:hypothetical protein
MDAHQNPFDEYQAQDDAPQTIQEEDIIARMQTERKIEPVASP